jgi:hypothetical protein
VGIGASLLSMGVSIAGLASCNVMEILISSANSFSRRGLCSSLCLRHCLEIAKQPLQNIAIKKSCEV